MDGSELRRASDTWESLMHAYSVLVRKFAADSVWKSASMREYDVLYTLSKADRALSQAELLNGVLLSQPALSRMLARMEGKGWITRTADPSDGRSALVALAESGRAMQRKVGRAHASQVGQALSTLLSASQMDTLRELCETLSSEAERS